MRIWYNVPMRRIVPVIAILLHLSVCLDACGGGYYDGMQISSQCDDIYSLTGDHYSDLWPSLAIRLGGKSRIVLYGLDASYISPQFSETPGDYSWTIVQVNEGDEISSRSILSASEHFLRIYKSNGVIVRTESDCRISLDSPGIVCLGFTAVHSSGWIMA